MGIIRGFGRLMLLGLLTVNLLLAGLMLLAAFSPHIEPTEHAVLSCAGLTFPIFMALNFLFLLFWLVAQQYKPALLPLLTFVVCWQQVSTYLPLNLFSPDAPDGSIKLLSYNIMGFDGCTKDADGQNAILTYLRESGADIICLQEYATIPSKKHLSQADVERQLAAYPYHSISTVGSKGANRLACYSKFPIIGTRVLSYPSQHNGSVAMEIAVRGDTLLVINNHLESNKLTREDKVVYADMIADPKKGKVKEGARLLVRKLAEASALRAPQADTIAALAGRTLEQHPRRKIVVCGDFNDTPISYTHRVIGGRLTDAFAQSGRGMGISYNQNRFYFRIDHILLSPSLRSYGCTVDSRIKQSDHYPIWCYIAPDE